MKHSEGRDRYAFPTLVFRGPGGEHTVPGWMPYDAYEQALEASLPGSTADPRADPTVAEALQRWELLTAQELRVLCGVCAADAVDELPFTIAAHFWGGGVVYLSGEGAIARGLPAVAVADAQALTDFAQACELAFSMVSKVPVDGWAAATPCADWDMRALVNHMVGSARMVAFGVTGRPIGPEFYRSHLGPDPVASYRAAIDEAVGACRSDPGALGRTLDMPWGQLSGARLAIMFAADHLIHAWDVAKSVGVPLEVDDGLVARVRSFGDSYAAQHRSPGMFDAEVGAAPDASPMDRLAAFVGRNPAG